MLQHFLSGFLRVFQLGNISVKHIDTVDITEHFIKVSEDFNNSFLKMKDLP